MGKPLKKKRLVKKSSKRASKSIKKPIRLSFSTFEYVSAIKLNLELAGMLFVNAYLQIKEGEGQLAKLEKEITKYKAQYSKAVKKLGPKSEDFITTQMHRIRNLEIFYEPVVRLFATGKVLLVCCAETYINEVASINLTGRYLNEFDKLSITGKWMFIQELLKLKKKMTLDTLPMQGFMELVKDRNKIVHFKGAKKSLQSLQIPDYLNDLNLTSKSCMKNLDDVKNLIRTFSLNWICSYGPDWLNASYPNFRRPCFYLNNRRAAMVLHSDKLDKNRFNNQEYNKGEEIIVQLGKGSKSSQSIPK